MEIVSSKFTVLFEEPFWIGLYERQEGRQYEVCKITFGSQPQDCQVLEFLLQNWDRLRFSPPSAAALPDRRRVNPKRMQRAIQRQVRPVGIGSKAQQALKRQQEQKRQDRKGHSRAQRSAQKERRLSQRQEKRRQKHRGH